MNEGCTFSVKRIQKDVDVELFRAFRHLQANVTTSVGSVDYISLIRELHRDDLWHWHLCHQSLNGTTVILPANCNSEGALASKECYGGIEAKRQCLLGAIYCTDSTLAV